MGRHTVHTVAVEHPAHTHLEHLGQGFPGTSHMKHFGSKKINIIKTKKNLNKKKKQGSNKTKHNKTKDKTSKFNNNVQAKGTYFDGQALQKCTQNISLLMAQELRRDRESFHSTPDEL
jgi:hypothetical protein